MAHEANNVPQTKVGSPQNPIQGHHNDTLDIVRLGGREIELVKNTHKLKTWMTRNAKGVQNSRS